MSKAGRPRPAAGSIHVEKLCGIDEAGRGPLAGPVTAGAVVLSSTMALDCLRDSKEMTARARAEAERSIREEAIAWATGWVWPEEIVALNIHHASLLAMRRAFAALLGRSDAWNLAPAGQLHFTDCPSSRVLPFPSEYRSLPEGHDLAEVWADGKFPPPLGDLCAVDVHSLIKGDSLMKSISAASIIAKEARDRWMRAYHELEPGYGFDRHVGYATKIHRDAVARLGPTIIHRQGWF